MSEKEVMNRLIELSNRVNILEGQVQSMDKEYIHEINLLKSQIESLEQNTNTMI